MLSDPEPQGVSALGWASVPAQSGEHISLDEAMIVYGLECVKGIVLEGERDGGSQRQRCILFHCIMDAGRKGV